MGKEKNDKRKGGDRGGKRHYEKKRVLTPTTSGLKRNPSGNRRTGKKGKKKGVVPGRESFFPISQSAGREPQASKKKKKRQISFRRQEHGSVVQSAGGEKGGEKGQCRTAKGDFETREEEKTFPQTRKSLRGEKSEKAGPPSLLEAGSRKPEAMRKKKREKKNSLKKKINLLEKKHTRNQGKVFKKEGRGGTRQSQESEAKGSEETLPNKEGYLG